MKRTIIAMTAATALVLAACGGGDNGDDDLLQMRGANVSREDFRTMAREVLFEEAGAQQLCTFIEDMEPSEVADLLANEGGEGGEVEYGTPVPGQTPDPDDAAEAASILQDECAERFD